MKYEFLKKVVVCPDSFKGSIDAIEAAEAISNRLNELRSETVVVTMPLSDGGEGISSILLNNGGWEKQKIEVHDALIRPISSYILLKRESKEAFIESAAIIGLPLLKDYERDPMMATSFGLGEAIIKAVESGCNKIWVSLGGSATCDGGMGMLKALGFKFLDAKGEDLKGSGSSLRYIEKIIVPTNYNAFKTIEFKAICDVRNPLYGEDGAAYVYAPQKGATPKDVDLLDRGLRNFAAKTGIMFSDKYLESVAGAGAAGGIGFALMVVFGADYICGIDYILQEYCFYEKIKGADLIITGEGKIDSQSMMGKVLSGVINEASKLHIPVISLAGKVEDYDLLIQSGLSGVYEIADPGMTLSENMKPYITVSNLKDTLTRIFK